MPKCQNAAVTGLPNKVCPRLRDCACWRSGEITQPRTSLIREPCSSFGEGREGTTGRSSVRQSASSIWQVVHLLDIINCHNNLPHNKLPQDGVMRCIYWRTCSWPFALTHDLLLQASQMFGPTRRVLTWSRVRHVMLWGNQIHSVILWTLGIPKMYIKFS